MARETAIETMLEARQRYFLENGFGADGGYSKSWDLFKLGPIPIPIPNPPARRRALQFHDLNHVLTGYRTDWRGEFEIAAWEIGAGCGKLWFAWLINLGGFAGGVLLPKRALAAFIRGRRSLSPYGLPLDDLLEMSVDDARHLTRVDDDLARPRPAELFAFALWWMLAGLFVLAQVIIPIALIWALWLGFVG